MPEEARLRGHAARRSSPYPLGELPKTLALSIGRDIVHRLAVGVGDITGDDFGTIFAQSIGGEHRASPMGIADVTCDNCAWSVKTVKAQKPFVQKQVRLISGRNSPVYSSSISDPFNDIQATGAAVLKVWNARIDEAEHAHDDVRIFVMIRNMGTLEFTLFEYEATRYVPAEFEWRVNGRGNFEGYTKHTNLHVFTWQPHGSQFTVVRYVPASAYRFRIKKTPQLLEPRHVLQLVRFSDDWIESIE